MILYRHKETGYQVSRDALKRLIDKDIFIITIRTYDRSIPAIKKQQYIIKEIPFNDAWEALDTGIDDFTIEELITGINIVRNYVATERISCSLLNKLYKLYARKKQQENL